MKSTYDTVFGQIFNIQRFCITDGDGIRTTVFLKGCPLHCKWCHNPESNSFAPQLLFKASRCTACGACVKECTHGVHFLKDGLHGVHFDRCTCCGDCIKVCCYDAIEICGKKMSVEDVFQEIIIDRPYFGSTGGVTISGGEPLAQPDFLYYLLLKLKEEGISTYIETSGYAPRSTLERISHLVDCFLFDWKLTNPEQHRIYVGVENSLIENNLKWLSEQKNKIILRCPIIPGVNDTDDHFSGIARLYRDLPSISHVEIMAYHTLGEGKKEQIGRADSFLSIVPTNEAKQAWLKALTDLGCNARIG